MREGLFVVQRHACQPMPAAGRFQAAATKFALQVEDVAAAMADAAETVKDLELMAEDEGRIRDLCQGMVPNLDFGLFTSTPHPRKLLRESLPVIWLTQMALWPELLEKFLHLLRCSPIIEDRYGVPKAIQRLLPHPDAARLNTTEKVCLHLAPKP